MAQKRTAKQRFDVNGAVSEGAGSGVVVGEILMAVLPMLRDFLPIFIEKWSESTDRPTLRGLEEEDRRLHDRIDHLERRSRWLAIFLVLQALAFLCFVLLVALKFV